MSRPCLIVEITDAGDWTPHFAGGTLIPAGNRPTVLQVSRDKAEGELLRLTAAHPHKRFAVFEAMVMGTTVQIPTHITLAGKVVAQRHMPQLVHIDDDEAELPF